MAQAAPAIVQAWSSQSTVPFFRVGNYAPVFDELTTFDPPVEGAIPQARRTSRASPLLECNFHAACRTDFMETGSRTENTRLSFARKVCG